MPGNVVIGSILGFVAIGICSVLVGTMYSVLRRITKLETQIDDLKRELEEVKGKVKE